MVESIQKQAAEKMGLEKDKIISEVLDGVFFLNQEELKRRARIEVAPDGREFFILDDTPRIEFYPIEFKVEDGNGAVSQKYRILNDR